MATEAVKFYFGKDYYVDLTQFVRITALDVQVASLGYTKQTDVTAQINAATAGVDAKYGYLFTNIKMDGTKVNVIGTDLELNGSSVITNALVDQTYQPTSSRPQSGIAVAQAVASSSHIIFTKVDKLPTTGESNVIYLVPSTNPEAKNLKDEFMWLDNAWEQVGSTEVDLSGYVTLEAFDSTIATINTTTAGLNTRLTAAETNISNLTTVTIPALTNRVTTAEGKITANTNAINTNTQAIATQQTAITGLQNTRLSRANVTQAEWDAMNAAGTLSNVTVYIIDTNSLTV